MKLPNMKLWIGVVVVMVVCGVLSYFSSTSPDGLERVAVDLGFSNQEKTYWSNAPVANGQYGIMGWIGVALVFGLVWLWGRIVTKGKDRG